MWRIVMALTLVAALVSALLAWRATHPRDAAAAALAAHEPERALALAVGALQAKPGDPDAAWDRALALRDLGLVRSASLAFDAIASSGAGRRSDEARALAAALRERERAREALRPGERAASPVAVAALADEERAARAALQRGDAALAEAQAVAAFDKARAAGVDLRQLGRRLLLVAADAARAQGELALADARIDEARLLMPE